MRCCLLLLLAAVLAAADAPSPLRDRLDLAGTWRVQALAPEAAAPSASMPWTAWRVPGNLVQRGTWMAGRPAEWPAGLTAKPGDAWAERPVAVPAAWAGRRVLLHIDEVELDGLVLVDGRPVGEVLNPGGILDLTGALTPGATHTLAVRLTRTYAQVSRRADADPIHRFAWGRDFDANARLALRGVRLEAVPAAARITDVWVRPSWRERALALEVEVEAPAALTGVRLVASVRDGTGAEALALRSDPVDLPAGTSVRTLRAPWAEPRLWEFDEPNLYLATTVIERADGTPVDQAAPVRFGFRELWVEGRTIMMNGHPCRWRLHWRADSPQGMELLRGMGFDVFQIQPNAVWSSFSPMNTFPDVEGAAAEADARGYGLTAPALIVNRFTGSLLSKPELQAQFRAYQERHLRRLRNHPSIMAWALAMNYHSSPSSWSRPDRLGRRPEAPERGASAVVEWNAALVRRLDPTRPVFGHEGGATADIHTRNAYLNWLPLSECEAWLSDWAATGEVPWGAVEFGTPYMAGDFFTRGDGAERISGGIPATAGLPVVAENAARRLGDEAYARESDAFLAGLADLARRNHGGHGTGFDLAESGVMTVMADSARRLSRAWRTWGLAAGALPWTFGIGYGDVPSGGWAKGLYLYKHLTGDPAGWRQRPAWANALYDAYRATQQPFLAWLSGPPGSFTRRDHLVASGGTLERGIALVWDGPRPVEAEVSWRILDGGVAVSEQSRRETLEAGAIRVLPLAIAAPPVSTRQELTVELTARIPGAEPQTDRLVVAVHPVPRAASGPAVALVDPAGHTRAALERLGIADAGAAPVPGRPLVVGRKALVPGAPLPFSAAEVAAGLRVLVCEQDGEALDRLGLRTSDAAARETFPRQPGSPLLAGLAPADLHDWTGSWSVLPERGPARPADEPRGHHWGNHGVVAGVLIETPHAGAFTPVVEAGFDLAYGALLTWRHGRGSVTFCQLDLSQRAAAGDPVAGRLLANLVDDLRRGPLPALVPATAVAGATAAAVLDGLGLDLVVGAGAAFDPARPLVVAAGGEAALAARPAEVARFLAAGGTLVLLGVEPGPWLPVAIPGAWAEGQRAGRQPEAHPLLAGVGPGLLRWRVPQRGWRSAAAGLPAGSERLLDGALTVVPVGAGRVVVSGIDPLGADLPASADAHARGVARLSAWRLRRLHAQLLGNLGIGTRADLAARLATPASGPGDALTDLTRWEVLGPFANDGGGRAPGARFAEALAPERGEGVGAITEAGRSLAWRSADDPELRQVVKAGDTPVARTDGYVDLEGLRPPGQGAVAYARSVIDLPAGGPVEFRLGCDYWATVWIDGVQAYSTGAKGGAAAPRAIPFRADLGPGRHHVLVKVAAGANGFGLWLAWRPVVDQAAGPAFYAGRQRNGEDPLTFVNW